LFHNSASVCTHPTLSKKIIFPVPRLRGSPVGVPSEVMMTMPTSTVDNTSARRPSLTPTISQPSPTPPESMVSQFDAQFFDPTSSTNLMVLREFPTRNSSKTTPNAAIDVYVDDDERNPNQHCTKHPATDATIGTTPLPSFDDNFDYKSELAAITAAIEGLKPYWPKAPPPPAEPSLPLAIKTLPNQSTEPDRLAAEQQLKDFLVEFPRPIECPDDKNHTHLPDVLRASASLTTTFDLQTQVLRTLNVLMGELNDSIAMLIAAHTCPQPSPIANCPPALTPGYTPRVPCQSSPQQQPTPIHSKPQLPPQPPHHPDPSNKSVPVKITRPTKNIPAKPPFIRGRYPEPTRTIIPATIPTCAYNKTMQQRTKDNLRPP